MVSCTEFIAVYNELFAFIEERSGKDVVLRLWEELADEFLCNLRSLVKEKGLAGMYEYWSRTLADEGGDYDLILTPNEFRIEMRSCPSVAVLQNSKHLKPYPYYCEHCAVLYPRIIEPFGYKCNVVVHDSVLGKCTLSITPVEQEDHQG